jgi:hypothetical protein
MALKPNEVFPQDFISATAEYSRQAYHLTIPRKWSFQDCLNPEVWKFVTRLRAGDFVTVVSETGDFDCDLRVVSADRGFAVMRVLREWHAPKEAMKAKPGDARTGFVPGEGWMLFDASGEAIAKFATEEAAKQALAAHLVAHPEKAAEPVEA